MVVPISASGDTITSGPLLFDVYVDADGNVSTKGWEISGSNTNGTYVESSGGSLRQYGTASLATNALVTINFPRSFTNTSYSFGGIGARTAGVYTVLAIEETNPATKAVGSILVATNAYLGGGTPFDYPWQSEGRWRV